ncbi:hypothetical protein LXA43DRAFT_40045 [Ganoderma leucocontextum]|nr:hypothetical protein LXA43DRAFT_40045 [Ganoderma leucocontextum]
MSARMTRKRARTESDEVLKQDPEAEASNTTAGAASDPQPNIGEFELEHGTPERLKHDAEFWFSDGTVILVAKNVEFRFYRALLADYSPVFKTMFAGQHPSRLVPIDEHQSITCPVVKLTDSPEDLRHISYYGHMSQESRPSDFLEATEPSFHQISAYIRLGHKYRLSELYENSVQFLKHHYTVDLETWAKHTHWEPSYWHGNESIGVVNLARLINEPSVLPTALLACVYMDEDILQDFEREDGTRETLTLDDIGRCFRASRVIRQAALAGVVRTFQDKVSPACKKEKSCRITLRRALRGLDAQMGWLMTNCPLRLTLDSLLQQDGKVETCVACTMMVKERIKKEREELWAQLPELLDIEVPGWGHGAPQNEAA